MGYTPHGLSTSGQNIAKLLTHLTAKQFWRNFSGEQIEPDQFFPGHMLNVSEKSSSSYRAIITDIPDPFSPLLPIVHHFRLVLRATPRTYTELLYVGSSWSPCFCTAMWRGPLEYITYELVPTSPACLVRLTWIVFVMGGRYYLPTPPLGQDMTQGQFLSGV